MNSSLVPEQRPDKNGVIVTRHVRADDKHSLARRPIPSPVPDPDPSVEEIAHSQLETLKRFCSSNGVGFLAKRRLLKTLRPDTLSTLAKNGIGEWGNTLPKSLMNHCINTKSCSLINDFAAYVEDHGTFRGKFYGNYTPAMYLLGVAGNSRDSKQDPIPYSEAGVEERIRQHAVIEAARSLRVECIVETSGSGNTEHGFPSLSVNKRALVDYIRDNPHKMEKVVQLVNERGPEVIGAGGSTLDGLLDNYSATAIPLSGGAL